MATEKINGTKVPDWILNMWVIEDREIARGMAAMEKDIESGLFPSFDKGLPKGDFGTIMVFGTGGDSNDNSYEKMFNNPQGYNLIEE